MLFAIFMLSTAIIKLRDSLVKCYDIFEKLLVFSCKKTYNIYRLKSLHWGPSAETG